MAEEKDDTYSRIETQSDSKTKHKSYIQDYRKNTDHCSFVRIKKVYVADKIEIWSN